MKKILSILLLTIFFLSVQACDIKRGLLDVVGLKSGGNYLIPRPTVTLEYKDDDEITVKKGLYYVGGKYLSLSADTDWTLTLDTGSVVLNTWYYIYAYNNAGSVGFIGSVTDPTYYYDTDLDSTTYDTNTYLHAIKTRGDVKIWPFYHSRERMMMQIGATNSFADTSYASHTISDEIPETAQAVTIGFGAYNQATASVTFYACSTSACPTGTSRGYAVDETHSAQKVLDFGIDLPIVETQTIYARVSGGNGTTDYGIISISGYLDKWAY